MLEKLKRRKEGVGGGGKAKPKPNQNNTLTDCGICNYYHCPVHKFPAPIQRVDPCT